MVSGLTTTSYAGTLEASPVNTIEMEKFICTASTPDGKYSVKAPTCKAAKAGLIAAIEADKK